MKRQKNLYAFLTFLIVMLTAQTVRANNHYMEHESSYLAYQANQARVHFRVAVIDMDGGNHFAGNATVYAMINGVKKNLFHYKCIDHGSDSDHDKRILIRRVDDFGGGKYYVTTINGAVELSNNDKNELVPVTDAEIEADYAKAEIDWDVPDVLAGKSMTFGVDMDIAYWWSDDYNFDVDQTCNFPNIGSFSAPSIDRPEILADNIAYNNPSQIQVLWMTPAQVSDIKDLWYTENNSIQRHELSKSSSSGTIYLDAFIPHNNIIVHCTSNYGGTTTTQVSEPLSTKMLHKPFSLTASMEVANNVPEVTLTWIVEKENLPDYAPDDQWEIQRNTTGKDEDWKTIGLVDYKENQKIFSFVDNTVLEDYDNHSVMYRVRRMGLASWGWDASAISTAEESTKLVLPKLTNFKAERFNFSSDEFISTNKVIASDRRIYPSVEEAKAHNALPLAFVVDMKNENGVFSGTGISLEDIGFREYNADQPIASQRTVTRAANAFYNEHTVGFGTWNYGDLRNFVIDPSKITAAGGTVPVSDNAAYFNYMQDHYYYFNGSGWISKPSYYTPKYITTRLIFTFTDAVVDESTFRNYARITWEQVEPSSGSMAVLSSNAKFTINVNMTQDVDENSKQIYSNKVSLTDQDIKNGYKLIEFDRNCVYYQYSFTGNVGTSGLKINGVAGNEYKASVTKLGDASKYYVEYMGKVSGLATKTYPDYVQLTWTQDGNPADYYRVYRADTKDGEYKMIADEIMSAFYNDKTAKPRGDYYYYIEAVTNCEGMQYQQTDKVAGRVENTGTIKGYVRMPDGTGIPDVKVIATPKGDIPGAFTATTKTDETGYFEINGLIYQDETSGNLAGSYDIAVESTGDGSGYSYSTQIASFDADINVVKNVTITLTDTYKFTGAVYYERSSIPVVGVEFLLDGKLVKNTNGTKFTTDAKGEFSMMVPKGTHSIQVVKDGHKFVDDGMLIDLDAANGDTKKHNFQKDLVGYYFWDKTKVRVLGRVTGGDIQGSKPLGGWASNNNLGDNLKMVLMLEGDNASFIYRNSKNLDEQKLQEQTTDKRGNISHSYKTTWERHRIVIEPDEKTGEFAIDLYPVKWKLTEASCDGYVTLFQKGKVGETYDFTDSLTTYTSEGICPDDKLEFKADYNAQLNFICHNPVSFEYQQVNLGSKFDFFGDVSYKAQDVNFQEAVVPLAYQTTIKEDGVEKQTLKYSMGYPVFMQGIKYTFHIKAGEYYYYNNKKTSVPEIVPMDGFKVSIHNNLVSSSDTASVTLDADGEGFYAFTPNNVTYNNTNGNALRSISMSLLNNGAYHDADPLQAYLMGAKAKAQGKRSVVSSTPILFDILRDPPGSASKATLKSNTKLSVAFDWNITASAGLKIEAETTSGADQVLYGSATTAVTGVPQTPVTGVWNGYGSGSVTIPSIIGVETSVKKETIRTLDFSMDGGYSHTEKYEYTLKEDISTSTKLIGGDGDVFMGFTNQLVAEMLDAVRIVPDTMYQKNSKTTQEKILATGVDKNGNKIYLVSSNVVGVGNEAKHGSFFYYTQEYILNQVIPTLAKARNELILPKGTTETEARNYATQKGIPVYISKVETSSDNFGGKDYYSGPYLPTSGEFSSRDSVEAINNTMACWINMLAINEKEKLDATDLIRRVDVDGNVGYTFGEVFSGIADYSYYLNTPWSKNSWSKGASGLVAGVSGLISLFNPEHAGGIDTKSNGTTLSIGKMKYKYTPTLTFNNTGKAKGSESYSKEISVTIAPSRKSVLTVDIYRTTPITSDSIEKLYNSGYVIPSYLEKFYDFATETGYIVTQTIPFYNFGSNLGIKTYGSYVYRTRGGMTRKPWEDQRVTKTYMPGAILDEKTVQIDRLRIWTDQAEVSNVPKGEPARFTVHLRNDTDYPDRTTSSFNLGVQGMLNNTGAKVYCDGNPLSSTGIAVTVPAKTTVDKVIEVYPAAEHDYNIGVTFFDSEDTNQSQKVDLAAHFVPSAGNVNISVPGDKWIMNNFSSMDSTRMDHYLPVRIDGYDTNVKGFDHIELQYKLSTQGDNDWVNMCSYFADAEKMALANGTKQLIGKDGYISTRFYGDAGEVEQSYDIRAVEYCLYGSGYLTSSSKVLSGIKDTRDPVLFGSASPANGILGIGDYIKIPFSENIASNNLSKINNFEVVGMTNSDNIALSTSLYFSGNQIGNTLFERDLTDKSFTVDVMLDPKIGTEPMCVFSHGFLKDNNMALFVMPDKRIKVRMMKEELISDEPVDFNGFHQIAYTFDDSTNMLTIYDGNKVIGQKVLEKEYTTNGIMNFGYDPTTGEWDEATDTYGYKNMYTGGMLEFRLWNHAQNATEIQEYSQKHLTGYELGLLDNYPMNEGKGKVCTDKSPSKNNIYLGADNMWTVQQGVSLKLAEPVEIKNPGLLARQNYHDYTMMFWFRAENDGTLMANGEAEEEDGYENHFNIGVNKSNLVVKWGGKTIDTRQKVADGAWHHFALSANRSGNVAHLYLDNQLKETFSIDTLGGIYGTQLLLGATPVANQDPTNKINGNIDEIGLFSSALPAKMIQNYSEMAPVGKEMNLIAWLPFSKSERQGNNLFRVMPSGISLKRYIFSGIEQTQRDTLIDESILEAQMDKNEFAMMRDNTLRENIDYNYVVKDNEVVINLNATDYQLEKTNVYVTVKDVADLHGNVQPSPITMNCYVYRNPLRWNDKSYSMKFQYFTDTTFTVRIKNLSGISRNYTLSGLPSWMSVDSKEGILGALDEQEVSFRISPDTNVGEYNEVIFLTGEDGMSEPLPIKITILGEKPDWVMHEGFDNKQMLLIGRVKMAGNVMRGTDDMVAAFNAKNQCMGTTHITVDETGDALAYLTLGSDVDNAAIKLRFYDSSTGHIYGLETEDSLKFINDTILGSPTNPILLTVNENEIVQAIKLKKGWNWTSFCAVPNYTGEAVNMSKYLNEIGSWTTGDQFAFVDENVFMKFVSTKDPDTRKDVFTWDDTKLSATLSTVYRYDIYTSKPKTIYVTGYRQFDSVNVKKGWNRIGYNMTINLPIEEAMAGYLDYAQDGDVLKSQNEFAIISVQADGTKRWKGNLTYMHAGEGYMLKRNGASEVTFSYPIIQDYMPANTVSSAKAMPVFETESAVNMNMVAKAMGIEVEQGDVLTASNGYETRGKAVADSTGTFYLTVGGNVDNVEYSKADKITFAIEREGDIIAVASTTAEFKQNAVMGSPEVPTEINFTQIDSMNDGLWYSVDGLRFDKRPRHPGVYIHNGRPEIIK